MSNNATSPGGTHKPLISGVIPALLTIFTEDGKGLNLDALDNLIEKLLADGANGLFVTGNTGEGFSCTKDERKQVLERCVQTVGKRVPIIAHVGFAGSTEVSCELAKHAEEVGADATSSVVPPEAPAGDDKAYIKHFAAIGRSSSLPFYVYYFSPGGGSFVDAEAYLEKMKDVPNFAGLKFTSKDFFVFEQLMSNKQLVCGGAPLNALTGPDEMALAGRATGADGCIGSTYNVQCRTFVEMYRAFDAGDTKRARELQRQANKIIMILIRYCDCEKRGLNISEGLKLMLKWQGIPCGHIRHGFRMSEAKQAEFKEELMEAIKEGQGVVDTFGLPYWGAGLRGPSPKRRRLSPGKPQVPIK